MRTRHPHPHTRNRSVWLWSRSTLVPVSLCLAFTVGPAPAGAADLVDHGPEAELLETHGGLVRSGLSTTSESTLFASPAVLAGLAASPCSPFISSGPNDPPMTGVLLYSYWSATHGTYIGVYLMSSGPRRKLRCDTNDEI